LDERDKKKAYPEICSGEYPAGAFALTEPHTGSDAANIQMTALRQDNTYIINGTKTLITSGEVAGVTVTWAVTDPNAKRGKGISAFVIEKGTLASSLGKQRTKWATGLHRATN